MIIASRIPAPPLAAYVERLWYCEGQAPYPRLKVLPVPSLHLMINLGDACRVYGPGANRTGPGVAGDAIWAAGLRSACHVMDLPRDVRALNVSFIPSGAYPFLQMPLGELRDRVAPLEALWGRAAAAELRERLAAAPSAQARLALLERLLLARLAGLDEAPCGLELVRHAVAQIARAHGALSIRALSARLGVSHKHLITLFRQLVGATPKAVARLSRLQHVLEAIDPAVDPNPAAARVLMRAHWAGVAQCAGYYDEAHLDRDVRAFTGHTPGECWRLLRRIHAEHPGYRLSPKFLPAG
jgi:AraC-like DNA-binding protein